MTRARWNQSPTQSQLPADLYAMVTPSDTVDLAFTSRQIRVATAGNLKVTLPDATTQVLVVLAGEVLPIQATRIWAAGTTATGFLVLF